jgi:M6 family metalloprotease-like protein
MKKVLALIVSITFLGTFLSMPAFGAVRTGAICTKAGSTSTFSGKKFTCIKSGKKLVWDRGTLIVKPSTQSTQTQSTQTQSQIPVEASQGIECSVEGQAFQSIRKIFICVNYIGKKIWAEACPVLDEQKTFPATDSRSSMTVKCVPLPGRQYLVWSEGPVTDSSGSIATSFPKTLGTGNSNYPNVSTPSLSPLTSFKPVETCELNGKSKTDYHPQNLSFNHGAWSVPGNSESSHGTWPNAKGTLNIDVIYVSYADTKLNPLVFNKWEKSEIPYAQKFYESSSYGQLHLKFFSSEKIYTIPKSASSYHMNTDQEDPQSLFTDAMMAAQSDYDFSQADELLVIMPDLAIPDSGAAYRFFGTVGGAKIHYGSEGAYENSNGNTFSPGWYAHEIGLTLGLTEPELMPWVGTHTAWNTLSWNTNYEQDFFAWEKLILGWIAADQMKCLDASSLDPVTTFISPNEFSSAETKLVVIRLNATQALVVESRRNSTLDPLTTSQEGALLYKLDLTKGFREGAITVIYNDPQILDLGSNQQVLGTLHQGESITAEGVIIKILKFTQEGDYISIMKAA